MNTAHSDTQVRVLVVDDDPDTRSIVAGAVAMLKFEPIEAEGGAEALELCQDRLPDLAVLDVMMPCMDGNELCGRIRALEGGELVAIVMLTAKDSVEAKVESLKGGADDYLTKPFHYQELQARLQALMRVRELNLNLHRKNIELGEMQEKLVEQERKLAIGQLAGTAAHELGQPISAIMLNCHLLEILDPTDEKYRVAVEAIKQDARRMADLVEKLKGADSAQSKEYYAGTAILDLDD